VSTRTNTRLLSYKHPHTLNHHTHTYLPDELHLYLRRHTHTYILPRQLPANHRRTRSPHPPPIPHTHTHANKQHVHTYTYSNTHPHLHNHTHTYIPARRIPANDRGPRSPLRLHPPHPPPPRYVTKVALTTQWQLALYEMFMFSKVSVKVILYSISSGEQTFEKFWNVLPNSNLPFITNRSKEPPPPRGCFFVGWFPNQELGGRGPPLKNHSQN